MLEKKSYKFFVLFTALIISACLPLVPKVSGAPDGNEPNDSFGTATTLTKGTHSGLSIDPYYDVDFYKIHLNVGDNMSVVLWNMTADLNLYLYDMYQNSIDSSSNFGTTVELVTIFRASISGFYYIRVYTYGSSWSNYSLNITDVLDDSFEENDNLGEATPLIKGSYENLVCADADYYNISLTSGENLTAQVTRFDGEGYFDLVLCAPNGTELQSYRGFNQYAPVNLVLRNAYTTGFYSVKINPSTMSSGGNYTLVLANVYDDIFEDNDNFATAANLNKGNNYANLSLYDADYYNVSLAANDNISVFLTRTSGIGTFNLTLFATDQTTVLWSSKTNYWESSCRVFATHIPLSGNYTLWVQALGDAWGNYSMSLGNLSDDSFEPNDNFVDAVELSKPMSYTNLKLYDVDCFKVYVTAGQNLSFSFRCNYNPIPIDNCLGSINISLYAPDKTTLLFQANNLELINSYYDTIVFVPAVLSSGFYYLKIVLNKDSFTEDYDIRVGDAYDDRYENNDLIGSAVEVVKFNSYSLALFDDDYFKIYLDAGANARVMVTRAFGPGVFGMSIYAPDGMTILNTTGNIEANGIGDIRVTDVAIAGYYIIKVRSYAGSYGNYTLMIGNVYLQTSPGGIAGFPIEWVLLSGAGIFVAIVVRNRRKSKMQEREGI